MNSQTTWAATASAIRKELKAAFPMVKFSVRSESYAGGDAVYISYTDGPTRDEVDAIVDKYQEGHVNSMEDIYEYSNCRNDIPQVKYVQVSRDLSSEAKDLARGEIIQNYGLTEWSDQAIMDKFRVWPENLIWDYLKNKSLVSLI